MKLIMFTGKEGIKTQNSWIYALYVTSYLNAVKLNTKNYQIYVRLLCVYYKG
jgi:hypothetical protein